jgi:TetR/AcrR family transcriptional regulator, cholesterol catabolism regulator
VKSDPTRRQAQRSAILEAAARAIADRGYHGMSMRDLAGATGKGLSSLYTYFSGKEEILFALQQEAFATLTASLEEVLAGVEDPEARLYAFISHHVRYFGEHPEVMRVLVHEAGSLPPTRRRAVRRAKEGYFEIGREILRQVIARGCDEAAGGPLPGPAELDRVAYSVFGMLNWIYGWYQPEVHGSPQELARTIHRIALCGLVASCPFRPLQDRMDLRLAGREPQPLLGGAAAAGSGA